jgi:hypothetical protein
MSVLPSIALFLAAASAPDEARNALAASFGPAAAKIAGLEYRLQMEDGEGLPLSDARYVLLPAHARLYREDAVARSWSDSSSAWRLVQDQWETLGEAGHAPLRTHVTHHFLAMLRDPTARIERAAPSRLRLAPLGQEAFEVELDDRGRIVRNRFADGSQVRELDYQAVGEGLQWPMRFEVVEQGETVRRGRFSDFRILPPGSLPAMPVEAVARVLAEPVPASARLLGAGWLSGPRNDYNLATDAAGRLLVFARSEAEFAHARILVARRTGETWSEPTEAPFSDPRYKDSDPWLTPDGRTLYFVSDRPLEGDKPRADLDLWRARVTATGFGTPEALTAISSDGYELGPELHDGWLYFNSSRPGGPAPLSIWRARVEGAGFGRPEALSAAINFGAHQGDFTLSPDGSVAVFWSDGADAGEGDLFAARREGEGWSKPVRLPAPINTTAFEFTPSFSPDGRELRFSSMRKPAWLDEAGHVFNGQSNLYVATADAERWFGRN